jgi:hypothetical protein
MLVATFGPSTAWMGTRITWDDGAFVLEGHGPITAGDVMDYDRQGHLLWMNAGARAWVGSKAGEPRGSRVVAATPARLTASPERSAAPDPDSSRSSRRLTNAKRALVVVIIVLIAMNVVLLLTVAGVIPTP